MTTTLLSNSTDVQGNPCYRALPALQVTAHEGQEFAEAHGLEFSECSATNLQDASKPFKALAKLLLHSYQGQVDMIDQLLRGRRSR